MSDTRRVPVTEEMIEAGRKAFAEALKIDAPEGWCLTHIYEAMAAVSANNSANLRDTEASPAISRDDELARLEREVRNELARAMTKFPTWPTDPIHAAMVIAEESGELMQAVLQACYEPGKPAADNVYDEAIQTAAMCLRFLLSLDGYVFQPGPQHEQVWVKEGE